jgi:hypothetical protein
MPAAALYDPAVDTRKIANAQASKLRAIVAR